MTREKDYFKIFCKVSKAFGTTLSKDKLLDLIVKSAVETMGAKAACLFLADETEGIFVPVAQQGLSDNYLHATPLRAKKVIGDILDGGHLYIKDATNDPRVENHEAKKKEGIASLLDVPIMLKNRAIGFMALYTETIREFTQSEIDFLSALADQGGMAIQNARLINRLQKNAMLFLDLASNINSTLEIKNILNNLTVDVCKALDLKGAAIRLLDKGSGELKLVASWGMSDAFLEKGSVTYTKSAQDALKGETLVIPDVTTDDRIHFKKEMKAEGVASMIVTPIKSREDVIGVLRLYSGVPRDFPEDTIILVKALAHQGALAIQNASMYLELQEDKKNLEKDVWSHRMWF